MEYKSYICHINEKMMHEPYYDENDSNDMLLNEIFKIIDFQKSEQITARPFGAGH